MLSIAKWETNEHRADSLAGTGCKFVLWQNFKYCSFLLLLVCWVGDARPFKKKMSIAFSAWVRSNQDSWLRAALAVPVGVEWVLLEPVDGKTERWFQDKASAAMFNFPSTWVATNV